MNKSEGLDKKFEHIFYFFQFFFSFLFPSLHTFCDPNKRLTYMKRIPDVASILLHKIK